MVLKVYALLIILLLQGNSDEIKSDEDFKYNSTMRRISALEWSTDLRNFPEMNFVHLYDYVVVSTHKYRHLVLKGANYKKLKSYHFFFKGNDRSWNANKKNVRENVLPSMKKTPYLEFIEFSPACGVLRAA